MWFAGTTAPTGWVLCNGATYTNSTYPNLVAVIGTTFGGTPGTNFMVPNISATTGAYYIRFTTAVGVTSTLSLLSAPVGSMVQWPVASSYPTGWLRCDGSAVSRTTYADLFALIGTTYGSGDGSSTFTLPNISAAGSGSPVYIIKATTSGLVEPSSVAHAASHVRGGTDIIDADRAQIDYVPANYTRNSAASGAGANTDLTAHLSGIDIKAGTIGLTRIIPTSISGTGAVLSSSGKIALTNVSSVTINNAFSSLYNNYLILLDGVGSGWLGFSLQLTSGGTAATSSYGYRVNYSSFSGGPFITGSNGLTNMYFGTAGNLIAGAQMTVYRPFISGQRTCMTGYYTAIDGGNNEGGDYWGWLNSTTSYDGFRVITSSGNLTGDLVIYGYTI
jgi:microcystin-dependent protein